MSQRELADRVGLTRQAVSAIEHARYVPNTETSLRMARVLGCRVEELFRIDDPRECEVHPAGPVVVDGTPAVVGRVGDRLVAHPLPPGRDLREGFIGADALVRSAGGDARSARLLVPPEHAERTSFLLGCDPSLGILADRVAQQPGTSRLLWLSTPSRAAIAGVAEGRAHLAGSHLRDAEGGFNVSHARTAFGKDGGLVVTLATWEQGFVVARGNPLALREAGDLARSSLRIVNRESGAGARQLLDELLEEAGILPEEVNGYAREVGSHFAVAREVALGAADAGVSLRAVAEAHGLDFVPLAPVRFDLLVPRPVIRHPTVETVLDLLQGRELREGLRALPGYEVEAMGEVVADIAPAGGTLPTRGSR